MEPRRKSHAQLLVQERTGRDVETLLRELYVEARHSQQEIADALTERAGASISRSSVREWLREYGITRDDRAGVSL